MEELTEERLREMKLRVMVRALRDSFTTSEELCHALQGIKGYEDVTIGDVERCL